MTTEEHKKLLDNIEISLLPNYGLMASTDEIVTSILSKITLGEAYYLRMLLKGPNYGLVDWNLHNKNRKKHPNKDKKHLYQIKRG